MSDSRAAARFAIVVPHLHGGGAERVSVNLANEFARRGFAVDMVLMSAEGELRNALDPCVRVIDLKAPRVRQTMVPLAHYLRQAQPAGMIANMWPLTVAAVLARRRSSAAVRLVLAEHTSWSIDDLAQRLSIRLLIKATMRAFYRSADAVVTVSAGAARDLKQFSGMPEQAIRVIYNPIVQSLVMAAAAVPAAPAAWVEGPHKRVLAVGMLKAIKDYPALLRAFAKLHERIDAKLLILGEGVERAMLEKQVRSLGLDGQVLMPGFVQDTSPYFAHADLHVLSSSGEGFGNVIVEALEQGTPVVSTDCRSGPREILADGKYGTLVPVGDVEALAKAMGDALTRNHDREELKRRAQDFSVGKAADAYLDLLLPSWRREVR